MQYNMFMWQLWTNLLSLTSHRQPTHYPCQFILFLVTLRETFRFYVIFRGKISWFFACSNYLPEIMTNLHCPIPIQNRTPKKIALGIWIGWCEWAFKNVTGMDLSSYTVTWQLPWWNSCSVYNTSAGSFVCIRSFVSVCLSRSSWAYWQNIQCAAPSVILLLDLYWGKNLLDFQLLFIPMFILILGLTSQMVI